MLHCLSRGGRRCFVHPHGWRRVYPRAGVRLSLGSAAAALCLVRRLPLRCDALSVPVGDASLVRRFSLRIDAVLHYDTLVISVGVFHRFGFEEHLWELELGAAGLALAFHYCSIFMYQLVLFVMVSEVSACECAAVFGHVSLNFFD